MPKFYRTPWNKENVKFIRQWWPHFGTRRVALKLNLTKQQVKSKADKMGLIMLAKTSRLCADCQTDYQFARRGGARCNNCHLAYRQKLRRQNPRSLEQWIGQITNTARHRSKQPSNLTTKYMVNLWHKQKGLCHYSGIPMIQPIYGAGRNVYSPSIDRVNPKRGYVRNNVVWCTWICNAGKSDLTDKEYIILCSQVVHHKQSQQEPDHDTSGVL